MKADTESCIVLLCYHEQTTETNMYWLFFTPAVKRVISQNANGWKIKVVLLYCGRSSGLLQISITFILLWCHDGSGFLYNDPHLHPGSTGIPQEWFDEYENDILVPPVQF